MLHLDCNLYMTREPELGFYRHKGSWDKLESIKMNRSAISDCMMMTANNNHAGPSPSDQAVKLVKRIVAPEAAVAIRILLDVELRGKSEGASSIRTAA